MSAEQDSQKRRALLKLTRVAVLASRLVGLSLVILSGALLQGCMNATVQEYGPLTLDLDGKSELHISTYPADFPRETSSVPFLYKELRSHDAVFFQVFVRAVDKKTGPNPHVQTINIRSFSYRRPGREPVRLIMDFGNNFWMQGDPDDAPNEPAPVPFVENGFLAFSIELTLNGQEYQFEGRLEAQERKSSMPLLLSAL